MWQQAAGRVAVIVPWLERHQVVLYVAALLAGAGVGLLVPAVSTPAGHAINPVLALLLYSTFLAVPFRRLAGAFRDGRFLAVVLLVNFAVVPLVAFGLSRLVEPSPVLEVGVLFVLLTPCVDYVIVFTRLAGGAADRLLAATPLLMLAQMALLPVYLGLMVGESFLQTADAGPFIEAFVLLIALPLAAAWLTQTAAARWRAGRWIRDGALAAMVPLMMATLAVVVASQIYDVGAHLGGLLAVVPVFVGFAVVMVVIGLAAGRLATLDAPGRRAVVFSGVTRNSLVVLPLVLALPAAFELAPLVVVTQTLVELVVMVVLVRALPVMVRKRLRT
ncbi:arsenic resistance protein [Citricoccus nitrophenolicus]|uniref:ACR3 family arsenite efflux pump ArsB n=2 Tax=Citricoccus muralis TaxID=169134 RepID=A0A3D9LCJ2_9MICC|nr:ACR3 family arsenite efflux pump ArsB [Citricoccus muralis]